MRLVKFRGGWAAVWWDSGKRHRRSLGKGTYIEAQQAFDTFRRLQAEAAPPRTVGDLWSLYRATLDGRPAHTTMGHEWKSVSAHFADKVVSTITEDDCRAYAAHRAAQGRKSGTVWTELSRVRAVLSWAVKKGLIEKAPHIWRPEPGKPRDKAMTRAQVEKFVAACEFPHIRMFAILAITTAGRAEALLSLTWDRVDFERGLIHLDDGDNRRRKGRASVPMTRWARGALAEAHERRLCAHVIEWAGRPVASVKKGIAAVAKSAGMPWITPHVFRHSAARLMAEAGVPMSEIAAYLGHSDSRITERVYAKYSPSYLRGASEALEFGGPIPASNRRKA